MACVSCGVESTEGREAESALEVVYDGVCVALFADGAGRCRVLARLCAVKVANPCAIKLCAIKAGAGSLEAVRSVGSDGSENVWR